MGVTTQTLMKEKFALQKTFNEVNNRINTIDKELIGMKANLSAVYGAVQQVEKLIQYDDNYGNKEEDIINSKEKKVPPLESGTDERPSWDIKPKEEPQKLNEGDKWKKIGIVL